MKKGKINVLLIVVLVLIIGFVFFDSHWSGDAIKGKKNILNSKKVKSQMSQEDILSIMGKTDTLIKERLCYNTNDDSYPYIEYSFDSLKRVKEIYSPEK